jgi:hypothetical protein
LRKCLGGEALGERGRRGSGGLEALLALLLGRVVVRLRPTEPGGRDGPVDDCPRSTTVEDLGLALDFTLAFGDTLRSAARFSNVSPEVELAYRDIIN